LSTDVSEVRTASIITALMAAARTSETSVDNDFTRQYIPEDKSELNFVTSFPPLLSVANIFIFLISVCCLEQGNSLYSFSPHI
jgi:hypothetical protein